MNDPKAVVSPGYFKGFWSLEGGVGYDINCGVRLIRTNLSEEDVLPVKEELAQALYDHIPVGVGSKGIIPISSQSLVDALVALRRSDALVSRHGLVSARGLQLERGQGALRGVRADAERGRGQGLRARAAPRPAAAGHAGGGEPLRGDPGGGRDLRRRRREEDGNRVRRPGGDHGALGQPRTGPPGRVGLAGGHGESDESVRNRGQRSAARLRTHPVPRGPGLSPRNGRSGQLCVGEPVGADVLDAASVQQGVQDEPR